MHYVPGFELCTFSPRCPTYFDNNSMRSEELSPKMPDTINHDDIQYSSDQDNPMLSNPAFSSSSALTPPHPPPHRDFIRVQSAGVVSPGNRGMNSEGPEHKYFCNPNAGRRLYRQR